MKSKRKLPNLLIGKVICFWLLAFLFWAPLGHAKILVSDFNNNTVLEFDDSGTLLGTFGDAGPSIILSQPLDIVIDSVGRVNVVTILGEVHRFDQSGSYLGLFLNGPNTGLDAFAIDSQDNLYLGALGNSTAAIRKYDTSGTQVQVGSFGGLPRGMRSLAVDSNDNLIVALETTTGNDAVYRFASNGTPLGIFGDASEAATIALKNPRKPAIDNAGNLFVVGGGQILKFNNTGQSPVTFATGGGPAKNLVFDSAGNLFATDGSEDDVLKYDSTGTLLGGSGIIQAGVGGVPATFRPEGIAFIESVLDADGDSVNDDNDLCPGTAAAAAVDANGCSDAQVDGDGDGVCDPGAASDGPSDCTGSDNCPIDPNPGQGDNDGDNTGDACDNDDDNDGVSDEIDNCPVDANAGQDDLDADSIGDVCDPVFDADSAVESIISTLEVIVATNPGNCADKVEDALDKAEAGLNEFDQSSPDSVAALGNLEGAVGDLEAAVDDGTCNAPASIVDLMDKLAGIARAVASEAIDEAPGDTSDAEQSLAEGDDHRAVGMYKDAVAKYKDALSKVS